VETTGKIQVRKGIIEAIAMMNDVEVPFRAVRTSFLKMHPEYETPEKLQFLSRAVTPLVEEHGILARTGKPKSRNNRYRFENPLMRGYVLLRMLKEQQQQLPI
jgi:hypothetical protein